MNVFTSIPLALIAALLIGCGARPEAAAGVKDGGFLSGVWGTREPSDAAASALTTFFGTATTVGSQTWRGNDELFEAPHYWGMTAGQQASTAAKSGALFEARAGGEGLGTLIRWEEVLIPKAAVKDFTQPMQILVRAEINAVQYRNDSSGAVKRAGDNLTVTLECACVWVDDECVKGKAYRKSAGGSLGAARSHQAPAVWQTLKVDLVASDFDVQACESNVLLTLQGQGQWLQFLPVRIDWIAAE